MNYWFEMLGYAGTVVVAISLMMNNIWRLRWLNFFGAMLFSIYGLLIGAYPVFALNLFIAFIDLYYIIQIIKKKDYFSLLKVDLTKDQYVAKFLNYHAKDISNFFPELDLAKVERPEAYFILRNMLPVGFFVFEKEKDATIQILLDYVIPDYRDLKNAHYVYSVNADELRKEGYKTFVTKTHIPGHKAYLLKIGFKPHLEIADCYVRGI